MFLFSESLICPTLLKTLPPGFILRPLDTADYEKGFLNVLSALTSVGEMGAECFLERFYEMKAQSNTYYIIVIEDTLQGKIAAAGSIVIEKKYIHMNGSIGHIEDIVVHSEFRGKNFGKWIIEELTYIGEHVGVYKIILDCSKKNVPFYEKCGYKEKEVQMVYYLDKNDPIKNSQLKSKL